MDPVLDDFNVNDPNVLKEVVEDDIRTSTFVGERTLLVSILPHEKENLISHVVRKLSYKIGSYDSVIGGILLDVLNISILNQAAIIDDGPACHIDVIAKFLIYQPKIDSKSMVEIKKVLVSEREYQAVLLGVCEIVVKFTSPIWLQEGSSVPFVIRDFDFDCENPFFICRSFGNFSFNR